MQYTLAAYPCNSVFKHTSQHGNANIMSQVQLCTSSRESPIPAKTDFADPVQDHMLLLLLMLILCCRRTTIYHSYCLDFLLFRFRFTRSCKHVIRTPLMLTSCNMTSSTLSHLCITIAICYFAFHCYLCRGRPHEKCPLCKTNY